MKIILCLAACFLVLDGIFAAPVEDEAKPVSEIIKQEFNQFPDGSYHFWYENSDGQKREEKGTIIDIDGTNVLVVTGSYTYIDANGVLQNVEYAADADGTRVQGHAVTL